MARPRIFKIRTQHQFCLDDELKKRIYQAAKVAGISAAEFSRVAIGEKADAVLDPDYESTAHPQ